MFGIRDEAIPNQRLDAILKAISQKLDPDGAFFSMHSDTYKAKDIMDLDPKVEDDEDARQFIKRKG